MEENKKISRREIISSSTLAGLALAAGALGFGKSANAQQKMSSTSKAATMLNNTKQSGAVSQISTPHKKNIVELTTAERKYKAMDFEAFSEKIRSIESSPWGTRAYSTADADALNQLPAIDTDLDLKIQSNIKFNSNNFEDLLDQASNLLDRGIKDRGEWDNLSIRMFYLEIEINQFLELDQVHREETSKGYYDQLLNEKITELNIERLNKENFGQISEMFSDMFKNLWNQDAINGQINNRVTLSLINSGGWTAETPAGHQAAQIAMQTTGFAEQYNMAVQKVYTYMQNHGLLNSADQSRLKEKLLKKQVDWEEVDRDFRLMRTDIDRKYEYIKLAAFKAEDGVLNLRKRMEPLKLRFRNDFQEANARLQAASLGLMKVHNYNVQLPKPENKIDYFDRCILWTREAVNWLISDSQSDQSFVRTVSISQLINKDNSQFHESLDKSGRISFDLDERNFFGGFTNVRLRGISMFIHLVEKRGTRKYSEYLMAYDGIIQSEVNLPTKSFYRDADQTVRDCDQSAVPSVIINRVASRRNIRQPDIAGTSLFNNLSPLGKWNLFFPQIANEGLLDKVKIYDIQLDLFVTAKNKIAL